jgi:serine protease
MGLRHTKLIFLVFLFFFVPDYSQGQFRMPADAEADDLLQGNIIFKMKPHTAPFLKSSAIDIKPFQEILDNIKAGVPSKIFPTHHSPVEKYHSSGLPLVDLSLIYQIEISAEVDLEAAINSIYASGLVEYAQPRFIPRLLYSPNDPMVGSQYYLQNIKAFEAWDISRGDTTIVIGIIDTGIDLGHPDLIDAIKYNYYDPINGEDSDNDGFIDNYHGWNLAENTNNTQWVANAHGVHVAGIAAANPDNGTGIAGVGFHSKVLPVKVDDEFGRLTRAYEGIVYAVDQGASVVNCSWGGTLGAGQFGQDIVNYAVLNKDAVVIAAAGNSNNQVPLFPASYNNVMSVAGTNINDHKWEHSSYGVFVDISAPGANVLSTWGNGGYLYGNGTSMAAPIVAGAAAILRAHFPEYTAQQIVAQLKVTTDKIDTLEANLPYQNLMGTGRLNMYNALTQTHFPYIQLTAHLTSADDFAAMEPNQVFNLASYFQNLLAPAGFIYATLSSDSPFVQIIEDQVPLGPINTLEIKDNSLNPFVVKLLPGLPSSHPVVFTVTFTNEYGDFAGKQRFSVLFNLDYVNVRMNDLSTTITSRGTLGYNYPNYSQGEGFVYKNGFSLIKNAGLIVGVSSSKIVDNIYGAAEGSFNQFLVSQQNAHISEHPGPGDITIKGSFTDANAGIHSLGIEVFYSVNLWNQAPDSKYIILEYDIVNSSGTSFNSLYAGFFADWMIRDIKTHRASFDPASRMGYAWSTSGGHYSGVALLSEGSMKHYAFDNNGFGGSIKINDGFTGFEKYTAMRSNRNFAGVFDQANDISTLVSAGPFFLASNDTLRIAFAMLAGDHFADLQASALRAFQKYINPDEPTDIKQIESSLLFNIFPNPVTSNLKLSFASSVKGNVAVSITDLKGRLLLFEVHNVWEPSSEIILDVSSLAAGQYFINLNAREFRSSMPFIRVE